MSVAAKYDIALSFAGEDRAYVDRVAQGLRDRGVKVFYDLFEEVDLWGKDLYAHLIDVYREQAQFTVMFISAAYGEKLWSNHERKAAQARAFQEAREYILPARFDATEIPGILSTVGYISLIDRTPDEFVSLIARKLVSSGGSIPTELVRRDFSATSSYHATAPTNCVVLVADDEGSKIVGCSVTAQAGNGTTVDGKTAADGTCVLPIKTRRTYRLLIAHPRFPAAIVESFDSGDSVKVELPRTENVGSVIIRDTGYIPGLRGRLNPILDSHGRMYLYADNIAIDGGKLQPATFSINGSIELEDADGIVIFAAVKHIAGRVALIQFTRPV